MLKFIRTTSTETGLVVTAYLTRNEYPTRLKPDPQLIASLRLTPRKVLSRWNYTIYQTCEVIFALSLSAISTDICTNVWTSITWSVPLAN